VKGSEAVVQKSVVLVGAGNSHLVFVRRWRMRPVPGVAVTWINAHDTIPYSAMTPACLNGEVERQEISIDLVRLSRSAGVRLVVAPVQRIDPLERRVDLLDRPSLRFDVLSLNVGSVSRPLVDPTQWEGSIPLRPLGRLLDRCEEIIRNLEKQPRPFHWVVVGGGASGCELAAALSRRCAELPSVRLTIVEAHERLLPRFPRRAARVFAERLRQAGVTILTQRRVVGGSPGRLMLEDGQELECDAVIWATPGAAPPLLRDSGLPVDADGFLRVHDTLQVDQWPYLFGAGDCISLLHYPALPHNGVYAVRQGPVLYDNILSFLRERPLRPFRPQRRCLYLLNLSNGQAVGNYGRWTFAGRWVRRWKERIDHRWLESFEPPAAMTVSTAADPEDSPLMRCGGCGAKVPGDVLHKVLSRLEVPQDPRVPLGLSAGEDAAVLQVSPDGPVPVQTVDYFRAFTDDPYLFGQAAAIHALSDLYAMNATPLAALAIVTLPFARGPIQEQMLHELLAGAQSVFTSEEVILAGGHTTEGPELALGFALTGLAHLTHLFRKNALEVGQNLVLTKPLGTGALWAAWMRAACPAQDWRQLVQHTLQSNRAAARIAATLQLKACTDITGFGLAGHLLEMLDASRLSARLFTDQVPLLDGFNRVVQQGIVSTLHADNAKWECRIHGAAPLPPWLFDPQTCGGLLLAVPPEQTENLLAQLRAAGYTHAAVIGQTIPLQGAIPHIELLTST
jgi:selenide,water dikinase